MQKKNLLWVFFYIKKLRFLNKINSKSEKTVMEILFYLLVILLIVLFYLLGIRRVTRKNLSVKNEEFEAGLPSHRHYIRLSIIPSALVVDLVF